MAGDMRIRKIGSVVREDGADGAPSPKPSRRKYRNLSL
jgi:hypothetical protein